MKGFVTAPRESGAATETAEPAPESRVGGATGPSLRSRLADDALLRPRGGSPLPPSLRDGFEKAFGAVLGSVRLHRGDQARGIGARAFTAGENVFVGRGQDIHGPSGRSLLGHELAHVLQQRAGRVRPRADAPVNLDHRLEAEADHQGALAARGEPAALPAPAVPAATPVIQGVWIEGIGAKGKVIWDKTEESQVPSHDSYKAHQTAGHVWLEPEEFVEFKQGGKQNRARYTLRHHVDGDTELGKTLIKKANDRSARDDTDVREFDVGRYGDMESRREKMKRALHKQDPTAPTNFPLEFDHQASAGAIEQARVQGTLGTAWTDDKGQNTQMAYTIALHHLDHREGRTYGGKNTLTQRTADGADLGAASARDHDQVLQNFYDKAEITPGMIGAMRQLARRNQKDMGVQSGSTTDDPNAVIMKHLQQWADLSATDKATAKQNYTDRRSADQTVTGHVSGRRKYKNKNYIATPDAFGDFDSLVDHDKVATATNKTVDTASTKVDQPLQIGSPGPLNIGGQISYSKQQHAQKNDFEKDFKHLTGLDAPDELHPDDPEAQAYINAGGSADAFLAHYYGDIDTLQALDSQGTGTGSLHPSTHSHSGQVDPDDDVMDVVDSHQHLSPLHQLYQKIGMTSVSATKQIGKVPKKSKKTVSDKVKAGKIKTIKVDSGGTNNAMQEE